MEYKVVITSVAEDDIDEICHYLLREKRNKAAAVKFINDIEYVIHILETTAESFPLCMNQRMRNLGYRKLFLKKSRYFVLYRVEDNIVYIDDIFHQLQDYENKVE